jgi:predicted RNase H-like HicB family nuclease
MNFDVTVETDEDGIWIVECPSIPGCVSQGNTKEEALESINEAIQLCLQVRAENAHNQCLLK